MVRELRVGGERRDRDGLRWGAGEGGRERAWPTALRGAGETRRERERKIEREREIEYGGRIKEKKKQDTQDCQAAGAGPRVYPPT